MLRASCCARMYEKAGFGEGEMHLSCEPGCTAPSLPAEYLIEVQVIAPTSGRPPAAAGSASGRSGPRPGRGLPVLHRILLTLTAPKRNCLS